MCDNRAACESGDLMDGLDGAERVNDVDDADQTGNAADADGARYRVNDPSVISEVIDGETIVLDFESGHYYSLNPSASEIWRRICAGQPASAATEGVARSYGLDPTTLRRTVALFVRRLLDEKLIRPAAPDSAPAAEMETNARPAAPYCDPVFEKFTDMEEMLLLDPIHEVADAGWPRKPD